MRIVAISDTHCYRPVLPDGDLLIHAGDICWAGWEKEWKSEIAWLGKQSHKNKLYIPGNHDAYSFKQRVAAVQYCADNGVIMLVDEDVFINDVTIYCSPWTPNFGWTRAYMHNAAAAKVHWAKLYRDADLLVTHGPPFGILDQCPLPVGCPDLLDAVVRIKPAIHLFGHIHTHHGGVRRYTYKDNKTTTMVNLCRVDDNSQPVSDPIFVCDVSKTSGVFSIDEMYSSVL